MTTPDSQKTDMQQMFTDITRTADICEVSYQEDVIWKNLRAYQSFFTGSAVAFRTTTKPKEKRDLSVRYLEMQPHDPLAIALRIWSYRS